MIRELLWPSKTICNTNNSTGHSSFCDLGGKKKGSNLHLTCSGRPGFPEHFWMSSWGGFGVSKEGGDCPGLLWSQVPGSSNYSSCAIVSHREWHPDSFRDQNTNTSSLGVEQTFTDELEPWRGFILKRQTPFSWLRGSPAPNRLVEHLAPVNLSPVISWSSPVSQHAG